MAQLGDDDQLHYTILVVDDYPMNIIIIRNFLKDDYTIKAATSSREGLAIMRSPERPDLVLLDIEMPEMDGIEFCKIIRADAALRETPIIFVTANTDDVVLARAFEAGGNDYIRKPVNQVELETRIKSALARQELLNAKRIEQKLTGAMEMAGAVCHELGQPLQSILTCTELLLQEFGAGGGGHDLVNLISEQCLEMAAINKRLKNITCYSTKAYPGGTSIIDIDKSTAVRDKHEKDTNC
jgi:CheY-like chemotaxis protein